MLTARNLIERLGGATVTAERISRIMRAMAARNLPVGSDHRLASVQTVHNWKSLDLIPRQWIPYFWVICQEEGINLQAKDIIALIGGTATLAQALDSMGLPPARQENLEERLPPTRLAVRRRRVARGRAP